MNPEPTKRKSLQLEASADLADTLENLTHIACVMEFHSLAFLTAMARDCANYQVRFFEARDGVFRSQKIRSTSHENDC